MSEYFIYPLTEKEMFASKHDVVVIRQPSQVPEEAMMELVGELANRHFLTVLLPRKEAEGYDIDYTDWYPTDEFRAVGDWIFVSAIFAWDDLMESLSQRLNDWTLQNLKRRVIKTPYLVGGNYLHHDGGKILIYAEYEAEQVKKLFRMMERKGWGIFPVDTADAHLGGSTNQFYDLDFLLSPPFTGRDGFLHAIAAESFLGQIPDLGLQIHPIPDSEAVQGGCNIADLRGGKILVLPHPSNTPTTCNIVQQYAVADIIVAPPDFLDGGGGPRCSISSFHL